MPHYLTQYYGLDWLAMFTSFAFMYFIGSKKRYGFIFGLITAVAWTMVNVMVQIWPGVVLNLVLIVLHIRGYLNWGEGK